MALPRLPFLEDSRTWSRPQWRGHKGFLQSPPATSRLRRLTGFGRPKHPFEDDGPGTRVDPSRHVDRFAAGARAERLQGDQVGRIAHEAHRAVREGEIGPARVA